MSAEGSRRWPKVGPNGVENLPYHDRAGPRPVKRPHEAAKCDPMRPEKCLSDASKPSYRDLAGREPPLKAPKETH